MKNSKLAKVLAIILALTTIFSIMTCSVSAAEVKEDGQWVTLKGDFTIDKNSSTYVLRNGEAATEPSEIFLYKLLIYSYSRGRNLEEGGYFVNPYSSIEIWVPNGYKIEDCFDLVLVNATGDEWVDSTTGTFNYTGRVVYDNGEHCYYTQFEKNENYTLSNCIKALKDVSSNGMITITMLIPTLIAYISDVIDFNLRFKSVMSKCFA